jgi:hypothetical protein
MYNGAFVKADERGVVRKFISIRHSRESKSVNGLLIIGDKFPDGKNEKIKTFIEDLNYLTL